MAEYVKRDDAHRALEQINPVDYGAMWDYEAHHYAGECLRDCKEAIDSIPAADVAPVVWCKGCKHKGWVQEPCHGKSVDYCRVWDCALRNLESTFCSYGEPKEGKHADDHD